jgi:TolA-binding protein
MKNENETAQKNPIEDCAAQLSSAAQALERVIGTLEAQYEALNQKIDRIIATVERPATEEKTAAENKTAAETTDESEVSASAQNQQVTKLAKENRELRQRSGRKTLSPVVSTLLAKSGVGESVQIESGMLNKALGALTIEQRIAVKAELARAGMIA